MRDFVKVSPTFWTGPTGRSLRKAGQDAQLTALYLMTCPHSNYLGLYILPVNYIVADTGLSLESVHHALKAIEHSGFARYDEATETIWLIEGAKWQLGELSAGSDGKKADNRIAMVRKNFAALPSDCPFLGDFSEKYEKALKLSPEQGAHTPSSNQLHDGQSSNDEDPNDI
ncbi:hypothetical protein N5C43_21545 [Comamonas terrigena]|uniref:hypothetical protein n=1 Tax=Comamonas terrigena TaxID=32013 RepID=UPI0024482A10|nr:hypothetical protein [Comamonas terrigena]MDH1293828.1 hypothetical protein [Comamonas terrigena]